jgi:ElaB/YqjD/DUF883 family membrane-anchored ribosome-binding protein
MAVTKKATTSAKSPPSRTAASKARAATAKTPTKPSVKAPLSAASKVNAKEEIGNLKNQATEAAKSAAERGKERTSEAFSSLGQMIRDSAPKIDESVGQNYGDYARSAADSVDGFAEKLNSKEIEDILDSARDFVRKKPVVVIGAAAAIGFAISRLIRSGKSHKED